MIQQLQQVEKVKEFALDKAAIGICSSILSQYKAAKLAKGDLVKAPLNSAFTAAQINAGNLCLVKCITKR